MQRVIDLCRRVARTRSTVLITGESGVGKEWIARRIHRDSTRRDKPMVVFNCHGVPETLLESELFGYERGAFTGAVQARSGLFERASAGTLLIDDVCEIPLHAQAKLLRVLQERRFTRLGGTADHASDLRIIATTQRDLRGMVQRGRFREDLFYRLNVFPIHAPSLRERREDIAPLVAQFAAQAARQHRCRRSEFSDVALSLLIGYHWPGNVRQLQSVVERALLLANGQLITEQFLPEELLDGFVPPRDDEAATSLSYAQRLLIRRALHEHRWKFGTAAASLGISAHVLRQFVARLGIKRIE